MLMPRNRLLIRILLLISFLALSSIIVAHIRQGGCLKGTGPACIVDMTQGEGYKVTPAGVDSAVSAAPFLSNEAKSVVILAYQRTGSSLFGRMFNSNQDDVFYLFEPLDSIYTAMYGTITGWNVPSDITNYANGSIRVVPERELTEVSELMASIFSCDIDRLPTQLLFSPFLRGYPGDISTLDQYLSCQDTSNLTDDRCRASKSQIEGFCGGRFGEMSEETLTKCYQLLRKDKLDETVNVSSKIRGSFSEYRACMKRLRTDTDSRNCSGLFRETCRRRKVRVIKSVRATMQSVEPLLRRLPNLRVIHLIRDPRGVVVSRRNFHESVRGRFSEGATNQLVREARLYCQTVVQDIRTRLWLEKTFPGRIYPVVYDDFVRDMVGYVRSVYRFLELDVPETTWTWVRSAELLGDGRNSTDLATAWQDIVSFRTNEDVIRECRDLFSLVGAKLPV